MCVCSRAKCSGRLAIDRLSSGCNGFCVLLPFFLFQKDSPLFPAAPTAILDERRAWTVIKGLREKSPRKILCCSLCCWAKGRTSKKKLVIIRYEKGLNVQTPTENFKKMHFIIEELQETWKNKYQHNLNGIYIYFFYFEKINSFFLIYTHNVNNFLRSK